MKNLKFLHLERNKGKQIGFLVFNIQFIQKETLKTTQ